ncbi:MAG: hypothetical protein ACOYBY_00400 [Dermatophilaceae bacterium]
MKSTTVTTRRVARTGDELLMDARRRIPAPSHQPEGRAVRIVRPVMASLACGGAAAAGTASMAHVAIQGRAWLAPAYHTTDVYRSASERPPV